MKKIAVYAAISTSIYDCANSVNDFFVDLEKLMADRQTSVLHIPPTGPDILPKTSRATQYTCL
jgi:hypothetical protein